MNLKHKDYNPHTLTRNLRNEWVPSIPLPLWGFRKKCSCGEKFWTLKGYCGHYALEHILALETK